MNCIHGLDLEKCRHRKCHPELMVLDAAIYVRRYNYKRKRKNNPLCMNCKTKPREEESGLCHTCSKPATP